MGCRKGCFWLMVCMNVEDCVGIICGRPRAGICCAAWRDGKSPVKRTGRRWRWSATRRSENFCKEDWRKYRARFNDCLKRHAFNIWATPREVAPASRRPYADIEAAVLARQTSRQDAGATLNFARTKASYALALRTRSRAGRVCG